MKRFIQISLLSLLLSAGLPALGASLPPSAQDVPLTFSLVSHPSQAKPQLSAQIPAAQKSYSFWNAPAAVIDSILNIFSHPASSAVTPKATAPAKASPAFSVTPSPVSHRALAAANPQAGPSDSISRSEVDTRLNQINAQFQSQIAAVSAAHLPAYPAQPSVLASSPAPLPSSSGSVSSYPTAFPAVAFTAQNFKTIDNSTLSDSAITNTSVGATTLSASGASLLAALSAATTTLTGLTVSGLATSTFAGALQASALNITGATSTFANGINLLSGCFAVNNVCLTVGGGGSSASALTSSFTVDTGQTVTSGDIVAMANSGKIGKWLGSAAAGTAVVPTTGAYNTNAPLVTNLDATHFIYAYRNSANGSKLTAIAGFISGTSIAFGSPVVFSQSNATLAIGALATTSATSFVISYNDSSDFGKTKAIAGSISSDTVLSFGTPATASASSNTALMVMLDATDFVLTYTDATNASAMTSVAGSVNTGTNAITFGTPVLASASTNNLLTSGLLNGNGGVVAMDSTHFLITYRDSTSSAANKLTTIAGSVSANAITFGSAVVASASVNTLPINRATTYGSTTKIDSTHFLISYWDSTNSNRLEIIAGLLASTVVSFGTAVQVSTGTNTTGVIVLTTILDLTHFELVSLPTSQINAIAGFLNGTNNLTIQMGSAVTVGGGSTYSPNTNDALGALISLDSNHFAVSFSDNSVTFVRTFVGATSGTNNLITTMGTGVSMPDSGLCSGAETLMPYNTLIDSTHYIITYMPTGCAVRSVAATISSGTTVTLGTSVVVANTAVGGGSTEAPNAVIYLDSTHYFITYADTMSGNKQSAIVASVNTGTGTITPGTSVFASGATATSLSSSGNNVSAALDSTHFAMVFNDTNNGSKITGVIGTLSGGTVSYGTPVIMSTSTTAITTVSMATTTAGFVVAYKDSNNSSKLSVVAASVSGTTITAGTPSSGVSNTTNNAYLTKLDGTHFVLTYKDSVTTFLTSIAGTVSGTTLAFGSAVVASNTTTDIVGNAGYLNSVLPLDSTHFVVSYGDTTSGNGLSSIVGVISSNTTVTFGSAALGSLASVTGGLGEKMSVLDSTHFVLAYQDNTNISTSTQKLTVLPGFVSGSVITYGSPVVISNTNSLGFLISNLDATHFVIAYVDSTNNLKGTAAVGTLSGANNLTVTMGTSVLFDSLPVDSSPTISTTGSRFVLSTFDSTHFTLAYYSSLPGSSSGSGSTNFRLNSVSGSVSGSTITFGSPQLLSTPTSGNSNSLWGLPVLDPTHAVLMYTDPYNGTKITAIAITLRSFFSGNIIGIAQGSGTQDSTVSVATAGVVTGLSGLTAGQVYYAQSDGTLGTTANAYQVGLALSATSILLKSSDTIANTNLDQFFGDAVFANDFRITEAKETPGLNFLNTEGNQIMSLDTGGNLAVPGNLSAAAIFLSLGAKIQQGIGTFVAIIADSLTAKEVITITAEIDNGFTTKDKTTGDFYCVYVDNGVLKTSSGRCDPLLSDAATSTPASQASAGTASTTAPSLPAGSSGAAATSTGSDIISDVAVPPASNEDASSTTPQSVSNDATTTPPSVAVDGAQSPSGSPDSSQDSGTSSPASAQ